MMKKNKIYLSGGGDDKQSFPLDKFFFHKLPQNGRFLYIPVALRGHELYLTAHLWMKSIIELHGRTDVNFTIADNLSEYTLKDLMGFSAIYVGGGNTWNLLQEIRSSGFHDELIRYLKEGGIIYGGSAGAIILGKRIDTHDDENLINLKDISGLDLLCSYSVACHFKDEQNDRFKKWSMDNNSPIVCLPEETGLIVEENSALCVGTKPCIIYFADGAKREVYPEESFKL